MKLSQPVTDLIPARSSWRRYQAKPIDEKPRAALAAALEASPPGPFGSKTRFELLAATEEDRNALRGLGTYGFIRDAPGFLVGAVAEGHKDMEDFGFVMESLILFATDLDLGTCWLGGTFNRSAFAKKIRLGSKEVVPAVAAVGHPTNRRGAVDKLIRWGAGSKNRKPWEALFFSGELGVPLSSDTAGDLAEPLEMVRLAPSASNKQPWRIVKVRGEPTLHLYLERTPGYGSDSKMVDVADLQRVDMGIAMSHLSLTARAAGLTGEWIEAPPEQGPLPEHTEYIATWTG